MAPVFAGFGLNGDLTGQLGSRALTLDAHVGCEPAASGRAGGVRDVPTDPRWQGTASCAIQHGPG